MSLYKLTKEWTKVADKHHMAKLQNSGRVEILYTTAPSSKVGNPIPAAGEYSALGLWDDLYARSEHPGGEVLVTAHALPKSPYRS